MCVFCAKTSFSPKQIILKPFDCQIVPRNGLTIVCRLHTTSILTSQFFFLLLLQMLAVISKSPIMKSPTIRILWELQVLQVRSATIGPTQVLFFVFTFFLINKLVFSVLNIWVGLPAMDQTRYDDGSMYFLVLNINQSTYVKLPKRKRSLNKKLTCNHVTET